MNPIFAEVRALTQTINAARGSLVGIAAKAGRFAVTETTRAGRKSTTIQLSGWQDYAACVAVLRQLAAK